MARSRNLKPGFFKDAKLVACSHPARLLFAGLWCLADYKGRLKYVPIEIKMEIFPADNVEIEDLIQELSAQGVIEIYRDHSGVALVQVTNFEKHQNPHVNEKQDRRKNPLPCLPGPEECKNKEANEGEEKPDLIQLVKDATRVLREYYESDPADSLNLIPSNLFPLTDSLNQEEIKDLVPNGTCENSSELSPGNVVNLPKKESVPFQKIVDLYHQHLPDLPRFEKMTAKRKGYIRQRWINDLPDLNHWENYFDFVSQSDFLMGRTEGQNGRKPFRANLEWLTNESNFAKVYEEKYHHG